ncbi:hypothetical protein [Spiroplasma sp. DGKH1]|uniref:hypothetical protein n=1 Tax=Spiroplasma sp. DGKH1 TaxID=3050074 RepID=UPI0034C6865A
MNNSWWTYVISVVVVISFLALFAGIYWRKKHHHRQDFNKQITRLVKNYHHFRLQKKFLKPLRLTIANNPHEIPFVKTKINIYPFTLAKQPPQVMWQRFPC